VEDVDGNRFLDFAAGISTVSTGHCHPEVVKAVQDQAAKLIHICYTDFYYPVYIELCELLARLAPITGHKRVFLTNSGAEAVETAIKLARLRTGRQKIVGFFGAFHGRTTGHDAHGEQAGPEEGVWPVRAGGPAHPLRLLLSLPRQPGARILLGRVPGASDRIVLPPLGRPGGSGGGHRRAGPGRGRLHPPHRDFLPRLQEVCRANGILLIADEVQSGMGRTGRLFAFEHYGIDPDMIILAKGIASGMPLSAVIAATTS